MTKTRRDGPEELSSLHGLRDDGLGVTSGPVDGYRGQPRDGALAGIEEVPGLVGARLRDGDTVLVDGVPMTLFVTGGDSAYAYWDAEMQCYCHIVVKAGVVTRFTSLTMAGPFTPREEPFEGEESWGV